MYDIFINAKSSRVDEDEPELEINKLRVEHFWGTYASNSRMSFD